MVDDATVVKMWSYERFVKSEFLGRIYKGFFMIPIALFSFEISHLYDQRNLIFQQDAKPRWF